MTNWTPRPTEEPKKQGLSKGWKIALGVFGGLFVIVLLGNLAGGKDKTKSTATATSSSTQQEETPVQKAQREIAEKKSSESVKGNSTPAQQGMTETERFKALVRDHGTTGEKAAVEHVTKVQVKSKMNNILDTAEVFTDFSGGMMGSDSGQCNLIASAFADAYTSENGLVSVNGEDGKLICTGNF
ncbi:hypothetical protein ACFY2H_00415 [Streptomyces griseofuscus]|uniref:hypothetical protein n=1 Tax=Streptomyces griseofuscus TaxID=146922 RepID=UPI0036AE8811